MQSVLDEPPELYKRKRREGSFIGIIPTSSDIKKKLMTGPTSIQVPYNSRMSRLGGTVFEAGDRTQEASQFVVSQFLS